VTIDPFDFREDLIEQERDLRPPLTDVLVEEPEIPIPESKLSRPLQQRIGKGPFKQSTPVMIKLELDQDQRDAARHFKTVSRMAPIRHEIPTFGIYAATLPNDLIRAVEDDPGVRRAFFDAEVKFPGPAVEFVRAAQLQPQGVQLGSNIRAIRQQIRQAAPTLAGAATLGQVGNAPLSTTSDPSWTPTSVTREILGAPEAESEGYTGEGITIAILDTGLPLNRLNHPQLSGAAYTSFLRVPAPDRSGHGSHVASIIGGGAYTAPNGMTLQGVAPGCKLLGIKVLETPLGIGRDSDIIKGLEIALEKKAHIVNMSLGSEGYDPDNPFEDVLRDLINGGVIPLAAVGNSGPGTGTVGTPAGSPFCISVGSINSRTRSVAPFSSRGPTSYNAQIKPDVVSFGGDNTEGNTELIYSTTSPGSTLDKLDKRILDKLSPVHGTSQATPHFAGVVGWWAQYAEDRLDRRLSFQDVRTVLSHRGGTKNNSTGAGLAVYDWIKALGG